MKTKSNKSSKKSRIPKVSTKLRNILSPMGNSEQEVASLTKSLLEEGCRDPLVVEKNSGLLIEGYRRLEICQKHNISYKIAQISLPDVKAAKWWRIKNHILRRNLSNLEKALIVIRAAEADFAEQAKLNQKLSRGRGKKGRKDSDKHFEAIDCNQRLADLCNLSRDTIVKTRYLLTHHDPEILQELKDGKISIHRAYNWNRKKQKKKARDKKDKVKLSYVNDLSTGINNQVICADVIDGLKKIPSKAATLVFTSPPFNVGMKYADNIRDDKPWQVYLNWLKQVFKECKRVLRPGGRCVVEIAETRTKETGDQTVEYNRPIAAYFISAMQKLGYLYRTTIIWDKGNIGGPFTAWGSTCSPSSPCVRFQHSYIFVFSVDRWDLPCTGDSSFLSKADFDTLTRSIWRQTPEHHGKGTHVAPMPVRLAENVIKLYSYKGDLVCDPFGGSATTAIACLRNKRRFVSIDASPTYSAQARKRVNEEMKRLGIKSEKKKAA